MPAAVLHCQGSSSERAANGGSAGGLTSLVDARTCIWMNSGCSPSPHLQVRRPVGLSSRTRFLRAVLVVLVACSGCYRNVFGDEFESCADVDAAIKEELAVLQSCSVASDCGQILEGTSCGCTNELVAHNDYDPARFNSLRARAKELNCSTAATDCSCPATNGFACTNGVCGWNYVP